MQRQHAAGRQGVEHRQLIATIAWARTTPEQELMQQLSLTVQLPDPFDQTAASVMVSSSEGQPGPGRQPIKAMGPAIDQVIQQACTEPGGSKPVQNLNGKETKAFSEPASLQEATHAVVGHRLGWRRLQGHQAMSP